jgi:hypothetical protein
LVHRLFDDASALLAFPLGRALLQRAPDRGTAPVTPHQIHRAAATIDAAHSDPVLGIGKGGGHVGHGYSLVPSMLFFQQGNNFIDYFIHLFLFQGSCLPVDDGFIYRHDDIGLNVTLLVQGVGGEIWLCDGIHFRESYHVYFSYRLIKNR